MLPKHFKPLQYKTSRGRYNTFRPPPKIQDEACEKLEQYLGLLLSWVGKVRLTGAQSEDALREQMQDAVYLLPFLPERERITIIDVGTGGGLPGMVWAICRPDASVTLLDSIRKKCAAVEQMRGALGLRNAKVVCARAENFASEGIRYDVVTARAVAAVPQLIEWLAPFPKDGGLILAPKGPKYSEELSAVTDSQLARLGLSRPDVIRYGPETRENYLLVWKK